MQYVARVPEGQRPSGGWPTLAFLHGYDEAEPTDIIEGLARHGPLSRTAAAASEEFLVVAPQLRTRGDIWREHGDEVIEIVHESCERHGGDGTRVYLTGFSFGGNGVFDLALQRPDIWKALWPVDPTRVTPDPGLPVWLSVGELARRRETDFIARLGLQPLAAATSGDRVILDEGEDHVGAARRAYADPRIYEWLLARRG